MPPKLRKTSSLAAVFLLTLTVMAAPAAPTDDPASGAQPANPSRATPQGPSSPALALPPGAIQTLGELPAFEPGLWEFRRKVEVGAPPAGQADRVSKCSDPRNDIRPKMTQMAGKGCRILGTTDLGHHFRTAGWSCVIEDGVVSVSNLITVVNTTSYEAINETRYGAKTNRTVVVATRVGDCPAASK
jgi:hypothetical protein